LSRHVTEYAATRGLLGTRDSHAHVAAPLISGKLPHDIAARGLLLREKLCCGYSTRPETGSSENSTFSTTAWLGVQYWVSEPGTEMLLA